MKICRTPAEAGLLPAILSLLFCVPAAPAQERGPQLLLTPKRLKRLERDRERQTIRWMNFENRVNAIADSSERGFELALYYAITRDEKRGREAIQWGVAHKCATRQIALILDWCGALASGEERQELATAPACDREETGVERRRDALFMGIVRGDAVAQTDTGKQLEESGLTNPRQLYAACEYIDAMREAEHVDLRQDDPAFFRMLPAEFLLSMKPRELEHPVWQAPAAALALVTLDPNLEGSQFLQGWAMEDRQILREGPGVAYELLWGDPYLPGISYQNLDPWAYQPNGQLFARTDWNVDACWIDISPHGVEEANCPVGWRDKPQAFGRMTLMPITKPCIDVPHMKEKQAMIIWQLVPHQNVFYMNEQKRVSSQADGAGMWLLPGYIEGKVCSPAAAQ